MPTDSTQTISKLALTLGAIYGATGVALGALGAHALRGQLSDDQLSVFQTGVQYQLLHAILLVAVAAYARQQASATLKWAIICIGMGVLCFSGSLYGLVLLGWRWLGPVTPIGGVLMISGWALLGIHALRNNT